MKLLSIFCLLVCCFVLSACDLKRKVAVNLNPGCNEQSCKTNSTIVVHVKADGPNDTLHYLWGFLGQPTLLLVLTEPNVELVIDWHKLIWETGQSISFTKDPLYSIGMVISRLLEFCDSNNTASLSGIPDDQVISLGAENFQWSLKTLDQNSDGAMLEVQASEYKNGAEDRYGNFSLLLTGYGQDGYGLQLPHLLHSSNCSQLEVTLDGLETSSQCKGSSRFALELLLASSEGSGGSASEVTERRSLDDEHTPGVFTVVELMTPMTMFGGLGGFFQWRPVAYTSRAREIESSTDTHHYAVSNISKPHIIFNNTLLYSFYGYSLDHSLAQAFNVSFGIIDDGFYSSTNFTTWSLVIGYRQPITEHLSLLVLLVMGIGLGVPVVLLAGGGLYMMLGKPRAKKDELFLSR